LRSSTPFWKKGGRKGGKYTKKGGIDTDRNTENPANLIPQNTDTEKTVGNTAVYNSRKRALDWFYLRKFSNNFARIGVLAIA